MSLLYDVKDIDKVNLCMTEIGRSTLESLKMHETINDTSEPSEFSSQCIYIFGIYLYDTVFDSFEIYTNGGHGSF